jgi:hypothetical protein
MSNPFLPGDPRRLKCTCGQDATFQTATLSVRSPRIVTYRCPDGHIVQIFYPVVEVWCDECNGVHIPPAHHRGKLDKGWVRI